MTRSHFFGLFMNQAIAGVLCLVAGGITLSSIQPLCAAEPSIAEYGTIINLAGRQRMLTQKMSKEALLVALKIDPKKTPKT